VLHCTCLRALSLMTWPHPLSAEHLKEKPKKKKEKEKEKRKQ